MTFFINKRPISPLGFGTWSMGGNHEKDTTNDTVDRAAIRYAIKRGINFINGAEVYGAGHTDELIGRAATGFPSVVLASKLSRETLIQPQAIPAAAAAIAKRFRRSTIDLLYVHWPFPEATMDDYLPAMFQLVDKGLVDAIGVSNFNLPQLKQAVRIARRSGHQIAAIENMYGVLYRGGRIHPKVGLSQPSFDPDLQRYCRAHGILMVAYTPLAKGLAGDQPLVQRIAAAHQAQPSQVALAWIIAQGIVPIVKSSQPAHIDENLGAVTLKLSRVEMRQLTNIATDDIINP